MVSLCFKDKAVFFFPPDVGRALPTRGFYDLFWRMDTERWVKMTSLLLLSSQAPSAENIRIPRSRIWGRAPWTPSVNIYWNMEEWLAFCFCCRFQFSLFYYARLWFSISIISLLIVHYLLIVTFKSCLKGDIQTHSGQWLIWSNKQNPWFSLAVEFLFMKEKQW